MREEEGVERLQQMKKDHRHRNNSNNITMVVHGDFKKECQRGVGFQNPLKASFFPLTGNLEAF
jgi:hypothetical protein